MTRGDEILQTFNDVLGALEGLRLAHYDDDQVRDIVQRLGSATERFFKSAIWPGSATDISLDGLINRLKQIGIGKEDRADLHALRELYNDAKHDPRAAVTLKRTLDIVTAARRVMAALIERQIGSSGAPVSKVLSRFLWVAAWDDYLGGLTEVYVSLPLPDEPFATHLDLIWIDGLAWDAMKAELLQTGRFHYGPDHFPAQVYDRFKNEDDFLNAGVWDGDYRTLISIIAEYEKRDSKDRLIPILRRDHMMLAVYSSVALAAVDVAIAAPAPLDMTTLTARILERADAVYAMPDERPWVQKRATEAASLIAEVPFANWKTLSGPYWNLWNARGQYLEPDADKTVGYNLDDKGRLVIG